MKPEKKIKFEKQEDGDDKNDNFLENLIKEEENFEKSKKNHKNQLKEMMYGFGDDINPQDETTQLLDQYSTDFLLKIAGKAFLRSKRRNKQSNEIKLCDVLYFIKDDLKQSVRAMKKVQAKLNFKRFSKHFEDKNISNLKTFIDENQQ